MIQATRMKLSVRAYRDPFGFRLSASPTARLARQHGFSRDDHALTKEQHDQTPALPFIADDIMETFDEPRSEEVFRLFGQTAEVGQVIYLTHHRHLCEMATQAVPTVSIHEIA